MPGRGRLDPVHGSFLYLANGKEPVRFASVLPFVAWFTGRVEQRWRSFMCVRGVGRCLHRKSGTACSSDASEIYMVQYSSQNFELELFK